MLSSLMKMLSSRMKCYHLELMSSSWMKCYHLGWNVIIWDAMLSSGANVIIWDEMLPSGKKCYHLGWNVIIWDAMLSSGANVIICWDKMLSSGANVIMVSSGAIVIIWCYDVIIWDDNTPLFYFSWKLHSLDNIIEYCRFSWAWSIPESRKLMKK